MAARGVLRGAAPDWPPGQAAAPPGGQRHATRRARRADARGGVIAALRIDRRAVALPCRVRLRGGCGLCHEG